MHSRSLSVALSAATLPALLLAQAPNTLGVSTPTGPVPTLAGNGGVTNPTTGVGTVPASLAASFGNSNNNIPMSWTPTQYQQVFDGADLPAAYLMTGLGFRQDEQFAGLPGASVDLEINLGVTTFPVTGIGTTFASNYNVAPPTNVLPRTNVVLPTLPSPNPLNPALFVVQIPFTIPYPWAPVPGNNPLVQLTNRGNSNGNAIFTYPLDAGSGITTTRLYGFPDTATTGTLGTNYGMVMCFQGANGSVASVQKSRTGCPGAQTVSFYETFPLAAFDMSNTAFQMIPSNGGYLVLPSTATLVPPVSAHLGLTDDSLSAAMTLPFTLNFPGGLTSQIQICSNGYIYLGTGTAADFTPSVSELLTGGARLFPFWCDLLPNGTNNVHYDVDAPNNRVLVTWNAVPEYGAAGSCTMQVVINASGTIEFVYQGVTHTGHAGVITGFSPGAANLDPGSRDISSTMPFQTLPDRGPLSEDSTRPVMGTVATLTANNLPGGSIAGIHMIGPLFPGTGIDLTPIGMTGCFAYVNPLITLSFAAASPSTPLPIPNDPALDGARIPVQAVLVAPGVNSFGVVTSDLCELIIGVL